MYIACIIEIFKMNYTFIDKFIKALCIVGINFLTSTKVFSFMKAGGFVREEENSLILTAFLLMLIIVIPVIVMAIAFFLKYSSGKESIQYSPDWDHSKVIELFIWGIPIVIVSILAYISWVSTHKLDPNKPINYTNTKAITIEAIALDWRWLFIYPEQNIATINEISFPINTPINFKITSNSVMNSLFIPQLGSQMYAMPGMQTYLHLIANQSGTFKGISSNFSGSGFSGMKFTVIAKKSKKSFDNWVKIIHRSPIHLNSLQDFKKFIIPKKCYNVEYFSNIMPQLFIQVINTFH